jgi:glycosyltransferase involved in cell wall biosynthesis
LIRKYIAVSDFIKQDLIKCGIAAEKIAVIHNGIQISDKIADKKYAQPILTIGIVGQLIERKGHKCLIESVRLLTEKNIQVRLIIAGDGDQHYKEELKAIIEKDKLVSQITWRGFKQNPEEIYDGMDIVIAPTITGEPFGLITIEANMFSLPVIVSNKGGFKETVTEGYNGFLIDPECPDQIADKVEYFYVNRDMINTLGNNGRANVLKYFDKKIMLKKIDNLIKSI